MEPKLTPVNGIFLAVNILVMAVVSMDVMGMADLAYYFGVLDWQSVLWRGQYWRFFSSMFLHFGLDHFFQNMVFLFLVGCYLETAIGPVRYFFFYLLSGIGAGIASVWYHAYMGQEIVSAGASGAILGIVGGLMCVVIRNKGQYAGIRLPGIILMIAGCLSYGFTSWGVDNPAHIGGFVSGFLLCFLFYRKEKQKPHIQYE